MYFLAEEVENLCRVLLRFDHDKEAANLQKLLSNLIQDMDNAKHEIWTADLMEHPQMVSHLVYSLDLQKCELSFWLLYCVLCNSLEMNASDIHSTKVLC
jgi:hypothetical protein